jgi:excisionase family DNA binding protein
MELLTVREAAQLLKVNPITVRRFIAGGQLAAVRVGKGVRVHREALERLAVPVEATAPEAQPAKARGKALTHDDPLWELVGSAIDAPPTDASRTHAYLAEGSR